MRWRCALAAPCLALLLLLASAQACQVAVRDLRVEYLREPLIDEAHPRFSWKLARPDDAPAQYNVTQVSYIITLFSVWALIQPRRLTQPTEGGLDSLDEWKRHVIDADRRALRRTSHAERVAIVVAGPGVGRLLEFYVDRLDVCEPTEKTCSPLKRDLSVRSPFDVGLLTKPDWAGAVWVASQATPRLTTCQMYEVHPAPYFRRTFSITQKPVRAALYMAGLGLYELWLNGAPATDTVINTVWTRFDSVIQYRMFDLTNALAVGNNTLGVWLGNGWWNPLPLLMWGRLNLRSYIATGEPTFIARLLVEYADGTSDNFVSDLSWLTHPSPILKNNIYLGEVYDARLEVPGWSNSGVDVSAWKAVAPKARLQVQTVQPVRSVRTFPAQRVKHFNRSSADVVTFPVNMAGAIRLCMRNAPPGHKISLRYGELVFPDGSLNALTSACGQIKSGNGGPCSPPIAYQTDTYIAKGGQEECFTSHFAWHGFRYVEVMRYPGSLTSEMITAERWQVDMPDLGTFHCSNELYNSIHALSEAALRSNFVNGLQSDCPHRERFGYGGDVLASAEAALLMFDMHAMYRQRVEDYTLDQRANGGYTETGPFLGIDDNGLGGGSGPIEWGTMVPYLQWELYRYYGDADLLAKHYDRNARWVDLISSTANDSMIMTGLGDFGALMTAPIGFTGSAFYYFNALLMARIATVLNKSADVETIAKTINLFFNDTGAYSQAPMQSAYAYALWLGFAPPESEDAVLSALIENVVRIQGSHMTTGIFGTKFLLNSLAALGASSIAHDVLAQNTYPSYGYMVSMGATTLWEVWAWDTDTYSHNHAMYASVSEFFVKSLGGIAPSQTTVGFDTFSIAPQPTPSVASARTTYESVRGTIVSEWRVDNDSTFALNVTIPMNSQATVVLPCSGSAVRLPASLDVRLSGAARADQDVYELGSGDFAFACTLPVVSAACMRWWH